MAYTQVLSPLQGHIGKPKGPFRFTIQPLNHAFGLWEEARVARENPVIHMESRGFARCEVTGLTTTSLCSSRYETKVKLNN